MKLVVRNLCSGYSNKNVIDDICFEVNLGEVVAVIGRNGCGKSTLIKTIIGDVAKRSGEIICMNGKSQDVTSLSRKSKARLIAVVEQQLPDVAMSVKEYVALGRIPYNSLWTLGISHDDESRVSQALHWAGIDSIGDRFVNALSGGEKQLCALARVIVQDTPIVIMDEPTSSLDIANQLHVLRLINELRNNGRAVICVIHDLNAAMNIADRVVMMADGRVKAYGKPHDVMTEANLSAIMKADLDVVETKDGNMQIIVPRK